MCRPSSVTSCVASALSFGVVIVPDDNRPLVGLWITEIFELDDKTGHSPPFEINSDPLPNWPALWSRVCPVVVPMIVGHISDSSPSNSILTTDPLFCSRHGPHLPTAGAGSPRSASIDRLGYLTRPGGVVSTNGVEKLLVCIFKGQTDRGRLVDSRLFSSQYGPFPLHRLIRDKSTHSLPLVSQQIVEAGRFPSGCDARRMPGRWHTRAGLSHTAGCDYLKQSSGTNVFPEDIRPDIA